MVEARRRRDRPVMPIQLNPFQPSKEDTMTCTPHTIVARLLAVAALLTAGGAQAYCVYNSSSGAVSVAAATGPGDSPSSADWTDQVLESLFPWTKEKQSLFKALLAPGQSACCPHSEQRCNLSQKPDGTVHLVVYYKPQAAAGVPCAPDVKDLRISLAPNGYVTVDNQALWGRQVARVAAWSGNHILRANTYCPGSYTPK